MRFFLLVVAVLIGTGYGCEFTGTCFNADDADNWENGFYDAYDWFTGDEKGGDTDYYNTEDCMPGVGGGCMDYGRRRIATGSCRSGCDVVLQMATKHEDWIREMVNQGLDSNEILQMVLPAVQDDCFDQIISTVVEANGKGMMSNVDQDNFKEFEKCIGWTELAMRASQTDPDLVLFKWIENLDEHLAELGEVCGHSLNELQSAALDNRLGGIEADLENKKWVINDFDKKAEFTDRVKHLDTNIMGLIALSSVYVDLLSAGKQLLLNACNYYANNDVTEAFKF